MHALRRLRTAENKSNRGSEAIHFLRNNASGPVDPLPHAHMMDLVMRKCLRALPILACITNPSGAGPR